MHSAFNVRWEGSVWLRAPIEDLFLPELEKVGHWGALTHQLLIEYAPDTFVALCDRNTLRAFIEAEQKRLTELEDLAALAWRESHRPPSPAVFDEIKFRRDSHEFASAQITAQVEGDWSKWLKRR